MKPTSIPKGFPIGDRPMRGNSRVLLTILASVLILLGASQLPGEENPPQEPSAEEVSRSNEEPQEEKRVETTHILNLETAGQRLAYNAVAGEMWIALPEHEAQGRIFYISYTLKGDEPKKRPITFAFNGGPGAASVWLHLGALGPKRVKLTDDGAPFPPPARYVENPDTWLSFTDLVFVDPVGTGFSRSEPDNEKTRQKFYGVEQDIRSVAEFIRLYLTRNDRWGSPKFLVGESYGTTRASALT